jgi:hypothetical protein
LRQVYALNDNLLGFTVSSALLSSVFLSVSRRCRAGTRRLGDDGGDGFGHRRLRSTAHPGQGEFGVANNKEAK